MNKSSRTSAWAGADSEDPSDLSIIYVDNDITPSIPPPSNQAQGCHQEGKTPPKSRQILFNIVKTDFCSDESLEAGNQQDNLSQDQPALKQTSGNLTKKSSDSNPAGREDTFIRETASSPNASKDLARASSDLSESSEGSTSPPIIHSRTDLSLRSTIPSSEFEISKITLSPPYRRRRRTKTKGKNLNATTENLRRTSTYTLAVPQYSKSKHSIASAWHGNEASNSVSALVNRQLVQDTDRAATEEIIASALSLDGNRDNTRYNKANTSKNNQNTGQSNTRAAETLTTAASRSRSQTKENSRTCDDTKIQTVGKCAAYCLKGNIKRKQELPNFGRNTLVERKTEDEIPFSRELCATLHNEKARHVCNSVVDKEYTHDRKVKPLSSFLSSVCEYDRPKQREKATRKENRQVNDKTWAWNMPHPSEKPSFSNTSESQKRVGLQPTNAWSTHKSDADDEEKICAKKVMSKKTTGNAQVNEVDHKWGSKSNTHHDINLQLRFSQMSQKDENFMHTSNEDNRQEKMVSICSSQDHENNECMATIANEAEVCDNSCDRNYNHMEKATCSSSNIEFLTDPLTNRPTPPRGMEETMYNTKPITKKETCPPVCHKCTAKVGSLVRELRNALASFRETLFRKHCQEKKNNEVLRPLVHELTGLKNCVKKFKVKNDQSWIETKRLQEILTDLDDEITCLSVLAFTNKHFSQKKTSKSAKKRRKPNPFHKRNYSNLSGKSYITDSDLPWPTECFPYDFTQSRLSNNRTMYFKSFLNDGFGESAYRDFGTSVQSRRGYSSKGFEPKLSAMKPLGGTCICGQHTTSSKLQQMKVETNNDVVNLCSSSKHPCNQASLSKVCSGTKSCLTTAQKCNQGKSDELHGGHPLHCLSCKVEMKKRMRDFTLQNLQHERNTDLYDLLSICEDTLLELNHCHVALQTADVYNLAKEVACGIKADIRRAGDEETKSHHHVTTGHHRTNAKHGHTNHHRDAASDTEVITSSSGERYTKQVKHLDHTKTLQRVPHHSENQLIKSRALKYQPYFMANPHTNVHGPAHSNWHEGKRKSFQSHNNHGISRYRKASLSAW